MTSTKVSGLCALALLISQALFLPASYCASAGGALSKDELTKQEGIYQSRGGAVPEGYVIGRSLALYEDALSAAFGRSLSALAPNDRWRMRYLELVQPLHARECCSRGQTLASSIRVFLQKLVLLRNAGSDRYFCGTRAPGRQ